MVMISNGWEVKFYFDLSERKYWNDEFFENKIFIGVDKELEIYTYKDQLPHLLIRGVPYGGVPAIGDFYSTDQTELLKHMNLCQTERGLVIKGVPRKKHRDYGLDNGVITVHRMPEINDIVDGNIISSFSFRDINRNGWQGTFDTFNVSDVVDVDVLPVARVNRAVNAGAGIILVNGIPTGIPNLHIGKIGPSEGYAIIDKDKSVYIPNNVSDIETIIDQLIQILPQLVLPHTGNMGLPTVPNPAAIIAVSTCVSLLTTLRATLK